LVNESIHLDKTKMKHAIENKNWKDFTDLLFCKKTMNINRLPAEIKREILYFIIPDPRTVRFSPNCSLYSNKHSAAFVDDKILMNKNGAYLSRIAKKNGKHRYYQTIKIDAFYCNECGEEDPPRYCCKNRNIVQEHFYRNKYLGKDMNAAFLELLRE
jgi:hypothetical protein